MATGDRLDPFPAVMLGSTTVLVDRHRPVAVLREASGERMVTWPDAPLPARAASAGVLAAPGCVWVLYSEVSLDGPDTDSCTAIRLGLDAAVSGCELGTLTPVGVDDVGVWGCPDPYLAMSERLPEQDAEDPDAHAHAEAHTGPPAWLKDAPVESWEDFNLAERQIHDPQMVAAAERFLAAAPPAQGHEDTTGWFSYTRAAEVVATAEELPAAAPLPNGNEERYGWFAYPPGAEPEPENPPPEPLAPSPTGAVTLRRVRPDGPDEEMTLSRVVSEISASGPGVLRVVFHPTGPVHTPDGYGGSFVHYPQRVTEIDVSAGLPAAVDLDVLASQPVADEWDDDEPTATDGDRVDLNGVTGTRWTPRPLDAGVEEAAVEAVIAQYTGLDTPSVVHTARDDRWHRVQSAYADVTLTLERFWPLTEVVLDFTYLPARGHLFRRRTRVFDDAGAPITGRYLGVYLDEDLATKDLDQLPIRGGRSLI